MAFHQYGNDDEVERSGARGVSVYRGERVEDAE